jgi:hypothetical protein
MQMAPQVTGKGLGKFVLQLVELMARQLSMELVMLYVNKEGKVTTMRLSKHKGGGTPATTKAMDDAAEFEFIPPAPPHSLPLARPLMVEVES